jgi:hypothetical protein
MNEVWKFGGFRQISDEEMRVANAAFETPPAFDASPRDGAKMRVVVSTVSADIDGSLTFYCRCGRKAIEGRTLPNGSTDYVCKRGHGWVANLKIQMAKRRSSGDG